MAKCIVISNSNELYKLRPEDVVYIEADGNYSNFYLVDGSTLTFTLQLSKCAELINAQLKKDAIVFNRLGRSLIVNENYVFRINPAKKLIVIATPGLRDRINLSASEESLNNLKKSFEK